MIYLSHAKEKSPYSVTIKSSYHPHHDYAQTLIAVSHHIKQLFRPYLLEGHISNFIKHYKISLFQVTVRVQVYWITQFAANRKVIQEIAFEVAKPLRRSDSQLEYHFVSL